METYLRGTEIISEVNLTLCITQHRCLLAGLAC